MHELMTPEAVAKEYGVPVSELARWRRHNSGPAYYTLTRQTIRYDPDSVHHWFHPDNTRLHNQPSRTPKPETTRDGSPDPQ